MTNRTPIVGSIKDGTPFTFTCPAESYINEFYGIKSQYLADRSKIEINSVGAKCSDGTDLGKRGGSLGRDSTQEWNITNNSKPFTNFTGTQQTMQLGDKKHTRVIQFMGHGTLPGVEWNERCPKGVATGIFGNADATALNALGIQCGPPPTKYCIENLEEVICSGVDADTLNKAC